MRIFKASKRKDCYFLKGNYADLMLLFCYGFVFFLLFFKVPHLFGHLFGSHPSDMPVKIQHIAALLMTGPCDPSSSGYVLTIRAGKMSGTKNITSSYITIGCFFKYRPPWPVFVVGKINGKGRPLAVRQFGCHPLHTRAVAIFTSPAVDDIANCLFFVWITRTAEYLDVAVIIVYRLLCKKRHKKLEPGLDISTPLRRARDERIVMFRIKVGPEADLTQIIPAHYVPALLTGLPQYRHQYPHQQSNDGNHHQQLYQSKSSLSVHNDTAVFIIENLCSSYAFRTLKSKEMSPILPLPIEFPTSQPEWPFFREKHRRSHSKSA